MIGATERVKMAVPEGPAELDFEGIYECVDLVYQAVERRELMPVALSALARVVGVEHVVLVTSSGPEGRRLLAEGHSDPRSPVHRIQSTSGAYRTLPGTRTVPLVSGYELVVGSEELPPPAVTALLRVTPHLSRALRLGDRAAAGSSSNGAGAAALDRLALGVALLDGEGHVMAINRVGRQLVSGSSLISLREGRLTPTQAVPRTLFEALLEQVLAATRSNSSRRPSGGQLELRAPGRATIRLLVAPYRTRSNGGLSAATVLLCSPGISPEFEQLFREHHGLDGDEARVATALVAGADPVEALSDLHASLVQEHRERIFTKLGSTRQSDLLRVLLRPPGVVFDDGALRD